MILDTDDPLTVLAELRRLAALRATPLDLPGLVRAGILRERGAWYEVPDRNRLPEHARLQIRVAQLSTRDPRLLVKFRRPGKPRKSLPGNHV